MNDTDLVIEVTSSPAPLISGIVVFILLAVPFSIVAWKNKNDTGGIVVIALSLLVGSTVWLIYSSLLDLSHEANVIHEVQEHYDVELYTTDGDSMEDAVSIGLNSRTFNLDRTGYTPLHFNYEGDLFTEARLDRTQSDDESIKYTLLVDVESNSSENMEEFSPELLDDVDTEDPMQEVDADSN